MGGVRASSIARKGETNGNGHSHGDDVAAVGQVRGVVQRTIDVEG